MKIRIFPEWYDPHVAGGPPSEWMRNKVGCNWSAADTARMQQMEKDAPVTEVEFPPVGRWWEIVEGSKDEEGSV